MSWEVGAVLLKAVLPQVAKAVVGKVSSKLNPKELEKALATAIRAAQQRYESQGTQPGLFYRCDDKQTDTFLARVFEH